MTTAHSIRYAGGFIPNAIIAGVPKSGTSSLHNWLAAHPLVMEGSEKETYFLSDPNTHMFREHATIHRGLDGYTIYFPRDTGQTPHLVLESTPSYIYSKTALERLADLPSNPRVIFVLREPSAQIYSQFTFFQKSWNWIPADITFAQFVDRALAGKPGHYKGNELAQNAIENARYVRFLRSWRDTLGPERMKIMLFEELKADPRAFTMEAAAFFGLDPADFADADFNAYNETYEARSRTLHEANIVIRKFLPKGALYDRARQVYRRMNTRTPLGKSDSDREVQARIKPLFAEDNLALETEFGLNLSAWS